MSNKQMSALSYLREQFAEGWFVSLKEIHGLTTPDRQWEAHALFCRPRLATVDIEGFGRDPIVAVSVCVEAARAVGIETRVLTCVYCGHEYPPGTMPSQDAALTEHIATCEKHPLAAERRVSAELRRLLWLRHGHFHGLYGDDGEMQCGVCGVDFKHDTPETINRRLQRTAPLQPIDALTLIELLKAEVKAHCAYGGAGNPTVSNASGQPGVTLHAMRATDAVLGKDWRRRP